MQEFKSEQFAQFEPNFIQSLDRIDSDPLQHWINILHQVSSMIM